MLITTGNCPSCGGPITFKVGSSIVVICEFCGSAVARTDRDLRNLGKVADLIDTQSPLRVGLEGRFDGRPFVLTGRVQLGHSAGGVWDEWYASFGGEWWGWLAEAQGRFYMTFPRQVEDPAAIPPVNVLSPGQPVFVPGDPTRYVVGETGAGRILGGQGEIPYAVQPGLTYHYADLSGPGGAFATIDYRQAPPVVFSGREVTLKEMGISAVVDEFDAERRQVKVARLNCPHCAGPLELRAPDASQRVTCPSCNALLDVDRGNLSYLRTLEQKKNPKFPLGSEAVFDGVKMTLVGFMTRGCQVDGDWYYWEEYLLYEPSVGFRWIVNGEGGWFFVEPASPGDVEEGQGYVRYHNKRFRVKESVTAVVNYVRGEFYWKVEIGEQAAATDYLSRSEMLSKEVSGNEVNWSFGRQIDPGALERAFDPKRGRSSPMQLPPPRVVTPPAPLPSMLTALGIWALLTAITLAVWAATNLTADRRELVLQTVSFAAETAPPRPDPPPKPDAQTEVRWSPATVEQTSVVGSFQMRGERNMEVNVRTSEPTYGKLYLKLVNDDTGQVRMQEVSAASEYSGQFENPGAGNYTLYAIHKWSEGDKDLQATVRVTEDVPTGMPFCFPIFLLAGPALLLVVKAFRSALAE